MSDYARHFVASTAALVLPVGGNHFKSTIARQFLPYCLAAVGDRFILLNREYKALGWPTRRRGFVDYADPQFASMLLTIGHENVIKLPQRTTENGTFFYLYGADGTPAPWESPAAASAYLEVLQSILGARSITREGAAP